MWSEVKWHVVLILRIGALHLTHPSVWGFGALLKGLTSVVVLWKRALYIHSPHHQSLPVPRLKPATIQLQIWLSNL